MHQWSAGGGYCASTWNLTYLSASLYHKISIKKRAQQVLENTSQLSKVIPKFALAAVFIFT
jgi:hypothetical protein